MMPAYYLWSPQLVAPRTLRGYLTEGSVLGTGRGTDALIARACEVAGAGAPVSWRWRAIRTQYFAPRCRGADWRDHWSLCWEVTAELAVAPARIDAGDEGVLGVDLHDGTFSPRHPIDRRDAPCVVIAACRDDATAERIARASGRAPERGVAHGRFPSLAFELGPRPDVFYAAGAAEAASLVERLAAAGASVGFERSWAWMEAAA